MEFSLHPTLAKDTDIIGELDLCLLLLNKEDIGPWIILVPKVSNAVELHHLDVQMQQQVLFESSLVMGCLEKLFSPKKLNLAALGNMVSQLHIHHIARFEDDIAWPAPIWGKTSGKLRVEHDKKQLISQIQNTLAKASTDFIPHQI